VVSIELSSPDKSEYPSLAPIENRLSKLYSYKNPKPIPEPEPDSKLGQQFGISLSLLKSALWKLKMQVKEGVLLNGILSLLSLAKLYVSKIILCKFTYNFQMTKSIPEIKRKTIELLQFFKKNGDNHFK
jgi:hypothetical protein